MPSVIRRILQCTLVGLVALVLGAGSSSERSLSQPSGDAAGLALLARVHHAYLHVPAVTLSGRSGSLSFRFTLVLRSGIGVAEQFVGREPNGTTMLVAHGSPTFVRDPGTSCWRPLAASSPQTFANIGLPFPDQTPMRVRAPRRTPAGWALPVVAAGDAGTFAIDGRSLLVRSFTLDSQGAAVVEKATALHSTPKLPDPRPRC
jgi:hypothetical protein